MKFSSSRKITLEPLPELSQIIRSFFIKNKNKELYDPWRSIPNGQPFWFSRSTISMKVIIDWYKEVFDKSSLEIYLPEYFCSEPIDILTDSGCNISYYNINDDLKPDWSSCIDLSKKELLTFFFLFIFLARKMILMVVRNFVINLTAYLLKMHLMCYDHTLILAKNQILYFIVNTNFSLYLIHHY